MIRKWSVVIAAGVIAVSIGACGGDDAANTTAGATTSEANPTGLSGSARITACTDAMNAAWADANAADNRIDAMAAAIDSEPLASTCDFLFTDEMPADLGVSEDDAIAQIERELDAELFDYLTSPVEFTFDEIGSSL